MAKSIGRLLGRRAPPPPEIAAALDALARLAEEEPTLSEAAALQGALLRAAAAAPPLVAEVDLAEAEAARKLAAGVPLLRGEDLRLDPAALRAAFARLADAARKHNLPGADAVAEALRRGALEPAALARAVLDGDPEPLALIVGGLGLPGDLARTLLRWSLFGPLSALAERLAPLRAAAAWGHGYCPTCGGWPLLAEQRGLEQQRYLRCGLCASSWGSDRLVCPFCASRDYEQLGYLFLDGKEQRRAATCDACRGYLKVLNALTPIPPYELPVLDLATLYLDMVALERGYAPAA
ncbi:MAG: formate dehydrogenase accessory protein FdhE [Chloroflexales bacterium]|nr:formate dehydrogenase accessory protein FdhE [Chloroflexales bacterium]